MNIKARGAEMEQEALIAMTKANAEMLSSSYRHDESYGTPSEWVGNFLRLVRPFLTACLIGLTAAIFFTVTNDAEILVGEDAVPIKVLIIKSVLFMTEMAVAWWWGDRRRANK